MIDSGPKFPPEQNELDWPRVSLEGFALIGANWALIGIFANSASF